MKIYADKVVFSVDRVEDNAFIELDLESKDKKNNTLTFENATLYPALINSHDHLVGNWFPRAVTKEKFPNSHEWVEKMKSHPTYLDRNKFWVNDGSFVLTGEKELTLCNLGAYKNIFAGCSVVQDHAPNQTSDYYQQFPINIIEDYRQCHSLPLGNWWGGESAEKEFMLSEGKIPFITHLGEGTDHITANEFYDLKKRGLLSSNTLLIHGIAFNRENLKDIAEAGASICWCPVSNINLIGKTLDIEACLELGVNIVLGTDSTLSGGINLLDELNFAYSLFPQIPSKELYKMISTNARYALRLCQDYAEISSTNSDIVVFDKKEINPFDNLLNVQSENIKLLTHAGKAIYGDAEYLQYFDFDAKEYSNIEINGRKKFVIGNPQELIDQVNSYLDYTKHLPYLPF